ncbi:hypothetical protein BAUCODRAFT_436239 [Baudoinia panamericana UAMH 10762]|uniref:Ketoreductase domain-containing protein n=1 Tax=Baudoinia panamericana (strain UAMH 10762) TaxID=717646 RepID=M2MZK2_BAUPA|nr:uncharacterized protein BAUCODRAFT_436239 [Baudoinia panamericana UAMH 10762]EMC97038.1 hypothetical protein BAUCODRAFT_436239 [Baudoinia panamericana UAMH 10762]
MEGKVYALTGATGGIGLALAKLLASRGAKVSLADISQAQLDKAAEAVKHASTADYTDSIFTQTCDVRDASQIQAWLRSTVDKFGKLDGAANLAGVFSRASVEEQQLGEWERVISINLTGTMLCIQAEFEVLSKGGSIVNATSIAGIRGSAGCFAYCASKHGVVGLTRVAALEGKDKGIRVNAIAPGYVDTAMLDQALETTTPEDAAKAIGALPVPRKADPMEVAKLIAFLLSDEASYITGAIYSIDGGMNV